MPLSADLESLCKELEKADPVAGKAQRELLEKHEALQKPLQESVLRQSDYDRKMNENKKKIEESETWKKWADKNFPIHEQMVKDYRELQDKYTVSESQRADLELKVTAAAAAAGVTGPDGKGAVDPAKLQDLVEVELKKRGYVSKTEMDAIIQSKLDPARTDFLEKTFPQAALWISHMMDAKYAHREEFGKKLDEAEFTKYLKDNGIADPMVGYERFVAAARTEKTIEAEATKRANEKIEEFKKQSGSDFPGTSGAPQQMGALQIRFAKHDTEDPLIKDASLGDGTLANAAAAELRAGK